MPPTAPVTQQRTLTEAERNELKAELQHNRSKHKMGTGFVYWESVVDVVDRFISARQ